MYNILTVISPNWKQPKYLQLENGRPVVYPKHEYYSAIKKNTQSIHATTWMNLKGIMLSDRCQPERLQNYTISFMWHSAKGKTTLTENWSALPGVRAGMLWRGSVKKFLWVMDLIGIHLSVVVTWIYACVNNQNAVYQSPWLVWFSRLSASLRTKELPVRFSVRSHAWVAGQVPSGAGGALERQPHIDVSLPLFLLPFPAL